MLRVTGGSWRGRRLRTLPGDATRPSMDAHRQSLMNVLGPDMTGERVLDLFAGSGAFGIECLSRGAARAVLVERSRGAAEVIRENLVTVGVGGGTDGGGGPAAELVVADCYALPRGGALAGEFDLVFVAPPYPHFRDERLRLERLLAALAAAPSPLLAADGVAVVQSDAGDFDAPLPQGLVRAGRRTWGRTEFTFLRREAGSPLPA